MIKVISFADVNLENTHFLKRKNININNTNKVIVVKA